MTSANCLQFPEIQAKFREGFTEILTISVDFQQIEIFEKSAKIAEICDDRKFSKIGAVQKYVLGKVVELEKC